MRHADRVARVFAFAANSVTSGVKPDVETNPTFARFIERAGKEYVALSPTPKQYDAFVAQIGHMWASQPNWTDAQLATIEAPVIIADGDHDEAIERAHTEYLAATIPGAGLLILPNASHFAFLQDRRCSMPRCWRSSTTDRAAARLEPDLLKPHRRPQHARRQAEPRHHIRPPQALLTVGAQRLRAQALGQLLPGAVADQRVVMVVRRRQVEQRLQDAVQVGGHEEVFAADTSVMPWAASSSTTAMW